MRRDGSAAKVMKVTSDPQESALAGRPREVAWTDAPTWWEAMGFEHERIESIGMEMFEVVEAGATRGKRCARRGT